jgi:hypothetical protein
MGDPLSLIDGGPNRVSHFPASERFQASQNRLNERKPMNGTVQFLVVSQSIWEMSEKLYAAKTSAAPLFPWA